MKTSSSFGKNFTRTIFALLTLLLLFSLSGCGPSYVMVDETETVEISKGALEELYRNNELLILELEACLEAKE